MTAVTRPRGPLPPGVYWVRRLLVLGVALLLVVGVAKVLGAGSDGSSGTPQAETVAGAPTGSGSYGPSVPATLTSPGRKKRRAGQSAPSTSPTVPATSPAVVLPAPAGPCADADVVVTPVLVAPAAGDDVVVRLDFTSRTSLACNVTVSPDTVVLKLTSRKGFVWSTQACPAAMPSTTVVARREVPGSVTVVWSGQYATSACDRTGQWALPGSYHAVATVLGGAETDVPFDLGPAVAATVTRTADPTTPPPSGATPSGRTSGQPTGNAVATPGSTPTGRPTGRPTGEPSGAVEPNG